MPGILIVDDNASVRQALRNFIEARTSLEVCGEASNGAQAIELAKGLHPALILMDLLMPVLDGLSATLVLKSTMPEIKIVLFTHHTTDYKLPAIAQGANIDLVLSKADSLATLPNLLKALLSAPKPAAA